MNFCATCGRQGADDARFCDGCGTEFRATDMTAAGTPLADEPAAEFTQDAEAAPAVEPPRWDPPAEAARLETVAADWTPGDATRVERQPDVTRIDTQGSSPGEPDPFAAWFATDPPQGAAPPRDDPPGMWQQPAGQG